MVHSCQPNPPQQQPHHNQQWRQAAHFIKPSDGALCWGCHSASTEGEVRWWGLTQVTFPRWASSKLHLQPQRGAVKVVLCIHPVISYWNEVTFCDMPHPTATDCVTTFKGSSDLWRSTALFTGTYQWLLRINTVSLTISSTLCGCTRVFVEVHTWVWRPVMYVSYVYILSSQTWSHWFSPWKLAVLTFRCWDTKFL